MAIGALELRERNESFNKRSGTKTPLTKLSSKEGEEVELSNDTTTNALGEKRTAIPKWAVITLCFCVFGGVIFELMQMIVDFMSKSTK